MKRLSTLLVSMILVVTGLKAQPAITNSFFEPVDYSGAFGATDWTRGWTNWTPQTTVYPVASVTIPAGNITTNTTLSPSSAVMGAADFAHAKLNNSFFEQVDYVGAFGATDWTAGWTNWDPQNTTYPAVTDVIAAGDITEDITLTSDKVYLLDGWVYVKAGATITIQPGTVIRGSKANKGALIVEKGAKIIAEGTAEHPIIFTSNQDAGSRSYGDWGGVIVLGKAQVNKIDPVIEGGPTSTYGGDNDADTSGILTYVRIEFPGIAFQPDKEINGLTFGGVGSGTTVNYIQVSYSGDDSYEWFGGKVNAKHLIAFRGWDDDFDTDYGYRGMVQFAVSLRDPAIADPGSGSNGFESDNDGTGTGATPFTEAVFSNISCFGPLVAPSTTVNSNFKRAMHLRRNTKLSIFNSVFAGYLTGLFIDGATTQANADNGSLNVENTILAGCKDYFAADYDSTYFTNPSRHNMRLASNADLGLNDPFNLTAPNFLPAQVAYLLDGWVYVKDGAILTIKPGTIIRGSKANKGALIIEKGAKLIAEGTEDSPIVFTSNQDAGSRSYGDWGGVIVLGKAQVNKIDPVIEGGPTSTYGGSNDADTSGVLKYIRIEFAGIAFQPDKEINGLTFGGVGSGTEVDYIQVSYSGDDSYEWFGGAVNAKHLIAFRGWDDDFDTDYGYRGMVQFAVSLRDPAIADPGSGSNSFESDNDGTGTDATPVTQALFSNVSSFGPLVTPETIVNSNFKRAMHLRRNTKLNIYNSLFAGYLTGLFIDGELSQASAAAGELKIRNTIMAGMRKNFNDNAIDSVYFMTDSLENKIWASNDSLKIADPFNLDAPDFLPETGSPVLTASSWYEGPQTPVTEIENTMDAVLYPNPFSEAVSLNINLKAESNLSVRLYNATGALVMTPVNGRYSAGKHEFRMNIAEKGLLLVEVTVNGNRSMIKLVSR
ncbi:MAG TPA: T9SS type A sorting domain-containing protein [Bacteroidales bacterium]|nr:T9SS type A sorting domain-containing protein [Bacteroidales bacterium]